LENKSGTLDGFPWITQSFRAQLVFSIGFALSRSRELLRRLLREHASDDARRELAERVVEQLEGSGSSWTNRPGFYVSVSRRRPIRFGPWLA
jgi:hypothetical protein